MEKKIYEIDATDINAASPSDDLHQGRKNALKPLEDMNGMDSDVTILVQAYNRLDKTKECISSILKYTKDVNYDLLLIDNGSTDGTFEYFKSIDYDKVRIIHINKNVSAGYPGHHYNLNWFSKYFISIGNDVIVTSNWLSNMLKIAESDDKIGMVNPVSSNVSNRQMVNFEFSDLEEMQKKAAEYNVSDRSKWHERIRLITLATLYKKECLYAIGWPLADIGFFHDFLDDDETFRVRRAGYKAILAKDTWIHHNHDVFNWENKDPEDFQKSINTGRKNFSDKYYGVDAWSDVNNFIPEYLPHIKPTESENVSILGIDVKCGTPILEIKNHIKQFGIYDAKCSAFTTDAKYYIDLQTICGAENVHSGNINDLSFLFENQKFDYIIFGENINTYDKPYKIIDIAFRMLKKDGQLLFSLKNHYDIFTFLNCMGFEDVRNKNICINYSVLDFLETLMKKYPTVQLHGFVKYESNIFPEDVLKFISDVVNMTSNNKNNSVFNKLLTDKYVFTILKDKDE